MSDTTVFNGEEVQIKFGFKNPVDFGGQSANPRRIQVTLYNEWNSFDRTAVSQSIIFDEATSTYDASDPDTTEFRTYYHTPVNGSGTNVYENEGISGWDTNPSSTHNYAISPSVVFNNVYDEDDSLHTHEVWFKFSDGTTDDKILIDNLQVGIKVLDDNNTSEVYGIITFFQVVKKFQLQQPEVFTITYTNDGNPVPAAQIDGFATVDHDVSDWQLIDMPGNSLSFYDYLTTANNVSNYGPQFNNLVINTLTQAGSGATATYQYPFTNATNNGVVLPTNTTTIGNGGIVNTTTNTTDDALLFDQEVNGVIMAQTSLTIVEDDWYFVDIIYDDTNFTPGNGVTINSNGTANGTIFEVTSTDIYGAQTNVLRAIFQADNSQATNGALAINIPSDTTVQIESIRLIEINNTYSGGSIDDWSFNNDPNPPQHSFDVPTLYGSSNGIEFDANIGAQRYVYQDIGDPQNTNDGYRLSFKVSNYVSGFLHFYAINSTNGIVFKKSQANINQNGNYYVDFNFDGGAYDLYFDDGTGPVVIGTSDFARNPDGTVNSTAIIEKIIFLSNPNNGFVGVIDDVEIVDLTNYFQAGSIDQFTISGFDPTLNIYIDYSETNNDGQIIFNNSPIIGDIGQVQIEQGIVSTLDVDDYVKLMFNHDITSGSVSGYYFNSNGKGFNFGPINSTGLYSQQHQLTEDIGQGQLQETFVIFVSDDDASGTIDNISMQQVYPTTPNTTISFNENVRGWTSFKSFIPEHGVSLSNNYFTFKDGIPYNHNSANAARNTFYGVHTDSSVEVILNDSPSVVKSFNTLSYEGTQSKVKQGQSGTNVNGVDYNTYDLHNSSDKPGWTVDYIMTDKQKGSVKEFIEKEGKWFNYIKGANEFKTSELSFQGIGIVKETKVI